MPLILFTCMIVSACAPETTGNSYPRPENLISEDIYIDILIEMQLAKTVYNSEDGLSNPDSVVKVIYDKYSITEDQYVQSHRWYQRNYKEQQERIEVAKDRLLEERARIETPPDSSQSSDS